MSLFAAKLLQRFHHLSLLAQQAGCRGLLTPHGRPLAGGTEATGVRDYAPGDDYRTIDWHWCARRDELLTRLFQGGEDRHTSLLLDCSPSMGLGSPPKFDLARQIAAALGYVSLLGGDCLRVAAFARAFVAELPPLRGKAQVARILRFLEDLPLRGGRTDLGRTAEELRRRGQRRGPVVVLSDFYDQGGFRRGLGILLAAGYAPRVLQLYDPSEADPFLLDHGREKVTGTFCRNGPSGASHKRCLSPFPDPRAENARRATMAQRPLDQRQRRFAEVCDALRGWCVRRGIACLQLASDTPQEEVLLRILGGRK